MYTMHTVSGSLDGFGLSIIVVQFYKDGVPFGEPRTTRGLTDDQLKDYGRAEIAAMEQVDEKALADQAQADGMKATIKNFTAGEVDLSLPPPTADQLLSQAIAKASNLKMRVDLGLIKADDSDFLAAVEEAKGLTASAAAEAAIN